MTSDIAAKSGCDLSDPEFAQVEHWFHEKGGSWLSIAKGNAQHVGLLKQVVRAVIKAKSQQENTTMSNPAPQPPVPPAAPQAPTAALRLVPTTTAASVAVRQHVAELRSELSPVFEAAVDLGVSGDGLAALQTFGSALTDVEHLALAVQRSAALGKIAAENQSKVLHETTAAATGLRQARAALHYRLAMTLKSWQKVEVWRTASDRQTFQPWDVKSAQVKVSSVQTVSVPMVREATVRDRFIEEQRILRGGWDVYRKAHVLMTSPEMSDPQVFRHLAASMQHVYSSEGLADTLCHVAEARDHLQAAKAFLSFGE